MLSVRSPKPETPGKGSWDEEDEEDDALLRHGHVEMAWQKGGCSFSVVMCAATKDELCMWAGAS